MYGVFLHTESERLQQDLLKVEQLEGKVSAELQTLRDQLKLMTQDVHTYRDLDALRAAGDDRKTVRNTLFTHSAALLVQEPFLFTLKYQFQHLARLKT